MKKKLTQLWNRKFVSHFQWHWSHGVVTFVLFYSSNFYQDIADFDKKIEEKLTRIPSEILLPRILSLQIHFSLKSVCYNKTCNFSVWNHTVKYWKIIAGTSFRYFKIGYLCWHTQLKINLESCYDWCKFSS